MSLSPLNYHDSYHSLYDTPYIRYIHGLYSLTQLKIGSSGLNILTQSLLQISPDLRDQMLSGPLRTIAHICMYLYMEIHIIKHNNCFKNMLINVILRL